MRLALPRAVPLAAVLAIFFGLAAVAHAQPGNVAVFDNSNYVDNTSTPFSNEGPNTIASLQSFGETVTSFDDISSTGFSTALAGKDSLVIPEMEEREGPPCLSDDMDSGAKDAVRNFVNAGGQLVVLAADWNTCNDHFVNDIFGFTVAGPPSGSAARGGPSGDVFFKQPAAAGTEFEAGADSIPQNNGTGALDPTSLPTGAKVIYADAQNFAAVVDIPFGDGSITMLGWDWFDSTPPNPVLASGPTAPDLRLQRGGSTEGGQDFGWQDLFHKAVDLPVLNVSDVSVTEGNSGTTPAGFTVTASANHSEVLHVNYATANGTATAGSDYTAGTGAATLDRSTLAAPVTVNVTGDTTIEPDETFSLGISTTQVPFPAAIGKASGTGTIVNDDVAKPTVGVAGVRRACVSSGTVHVRFSINAPAGIKSVTVSLDGKRVTRTTKSRFTVSLKAGKLKSGRHRLTAVALDNHGQTTTVRKTVSVCAAAKPKRQTGPRFTG
jgi:Calx-beta domain/Bacterial Ig domain